MGAIGENHENSLIWSNTLRVVASWEVEDSVGLMYGWVGVCLFQIGVNSRGRRP